jgi:hypothetical protein
MRVSLPDGSRASNPAKSRCVDKTAGFGGSTFAAWLRPMRRRLQCYGWRDDSSFVMRAWCGPMAAKTYGGVVRKRLLRLCAPAAERERRFSLRRPRPCAGSVPCVREVHGQFRPGPVERAENRERAPVRVPSPQEPRRTRAADESCGCRVKGRHDRASSRLLDRPPPGASRS